MSEVSGVQWCSRYPSSKNINDLAPPFRGDVQTMIQRLLEAKGSVDVLDTYRPPERAYLMHFCCEIAGYTLNGVYHQMKPVDVPFMPGVNIDWTHGGNNAAARSGALAMKQSYNIAYPAALHSNHVKRLALDLEVMIPKGATLVDGQGRPMVLDRDVTQADPLFIRFAASFGVLHNLPNDVNHFSIDGY